MPICQVCGEEVEHVTRCRRCDILFCDECGSVEERLCTFCQEELEAKEDFDYEKVGGGI